MADELKESLVISELLTSTNHNSPCSAHCQLHKKKSKHTSNRFSRGFCEPEGKNFDVVVYVGTDKTMTNFLMMVKNAEFYQYTGNKGFVQVNSLSLLKQSSFLIEKVKAAQNIGILVCTLGVDRFLDAIEHVKKLCKRRNKNVYIISLGKPTPSKLANFTEIDVFVSIACPEADFYERNSFVHPVVGVLEVELALNESRTWENAFSRDFKDLVEGGKDYVAPPDGEPLDNPEVSLVTNRLHGVGNVSSGDLDIDVIPDRSVTRMNLNSKERTWDGLDPSVSVVSEPNKAVQGRVGTSQGYKNEKDALNNESVD